MTINDVNLMDLRLLSKAVELGSLASAARVLAIPKASATRQLQRLEKVLNCRLVQRGGRRFILTEEGQALLPRFRVGLAAIDDAMKVALPKPGPPSGVLRIAAPYSYGRKVLSPRLPRFMAQYPALDIVLILGSQHADLLADETDVAIRVGTTGPDNLIVRRLSKEEFALYASPTYLAGAPLGDIDDLPKHRFLSFRTGPAAASVVLERNGATRRLAVRPVLRSNEPDVLIQAAANHVGVAILPCSLVEDLLTEGRLVIPLPEWRPAPWDVNAIFAPGRGETPKVRAFLDFLVEDFATPLRQPKRRS